MNTGADVVALAALASRSPGPVMGNVPLSDSLPREALPRLNADALLSRVMVRATKRQSRIPLAKQPVLVLLVTCASALLVFGSAALAGSTKPWTVTDVGTPPHQSGAFMNAVGINDRGDVIGTALEGAPGHQQFQGFVWRSGKMTLLTYPGSASIVVSAINARGDVAGGEGSADGGTQSSVLWRNGAPIVLGTLGGKTSVPVALNDHDQVVGNSQTRDGKRHAFIWQNGRMSDLGTLGGDVAQVVGINNRGQVIGSSTTAGGRTHAFLWQSRRMTDLGSLPGLDSAPEAINDKGLIVGEAMRRSAGGPADAVMWKNGKLVNLGRFGSAGAAAIAVNSRGHVLVVLTTRGGDPKAGVLLHDGRTTHIGPLGGHAPSGQGGPLRLLGLNDKDQVAGFGYAKSGGRRTFIWQNGHTTILPTFDGVQPPWGAPTSLNNTGALVGTSYVSHGGKNFQHVVVWRP
jgi:probable HAF family extracellular repeat protein